MKFNEKVIVVTGAGSGMGRYLVLQLLEKGANVAAVEVNPDSLKETVEMANVDPKRLSSHVLDVRDVAGVEALPGQVLEHHGKIDGIINNAGVSQDKSPFQLLPKDRAQFVMDINVTAILNLTREFLPHILKSESGLLANTASMAGYVPLPEMAVYAASKGAIKLFTESLYAELKETNVTVSCIMPGAIDTNLMENSGSGKGKIDGISPSEAAKIIIKGLEKDKLRVLVGKDARMLDKMFRLMPVRAINVVKNLMEKGIQEQ